MDHRGQGSSININFVSHYPLPNSMLSLVPRPLPMRKNGHMCVSNYLYHKIFQILIQTHGKIHGVQVYGAHLGTMKISYPYSCLRGIQSSEPTTEVCSPSSEAHTKLPRLVIGVPLHCQRFSFAFKFNSRCTVNKTSHKRTWKKGHVVRSLEHQHLTELWTRCWQTRICEPTKGWSTNEVIVHGANSLVY